MNKFLYALTLTSGVLLGSAASADERLSLYINGHVKIEDDEVVFRFSCEQYSQCKIAVKDFKISLTTNRRIATVQINSADKALEFFNQNQIALVEYGKIAKTLSIYDRGDEAYIKDSGNKPIGFLKITVTRPD